MALVRSNIVFWKVWKKIYNRAYTVKSGYTLTSQTRESQALLSSSNDPRVLELKRSIWKIPTIPKIRSFLWRAASGALAVAERLNTRGMQLDTRCKLCSYDSESIGHVLFTCPAAQEAWSRIGLQMTGQSSNLPLVELLQLQLKMMDEEAIPKEKRQAVPWVLWMIWKNKNSILYAETQLSLDIQIQQVLEEARLWNELNDEPDIDDTRDGLLGECKNGNLLSPDSRNVISIQTGQTRSYIVEELSSFETIQATFFIMREMLLPSHLVD